MSKLRRVSDVERTCTMLDLLHRQFGVSTEAHMPPKNVVLEEVAPGTGSFARRWADVLILGCWPSSGLELDGYEVKASKADLKKELCDLSKHRAVAKYCDRWTLVVWDESVLVEEELIPAEWGITVTVEGEHGRELKVKRRPTKNPEPALWSRQFVASMVRNAYQQSPGAGLLARVAREASDRAYRDGQSQTEAKWEAVMYPVARAVYGTNSYSWPLGATDPEKLAAAVTEKLATLALPLEGVR